MIDPGIDVSSGPAQAALYREQGFLFPIRALPAARAAELAAWLEALPKERLEALEVPWVQKSYLLFPALDEVIRSPAILDAVETVFRPDLIVLRASLFIQPARRNRPLSSPQDAHS